MGDNVPFTVMATIWLRRSFLVMFAISILLSLLNFIMIIYYLNIGNFEVFRSYQNYVFLVLCIALQLTLFKKLIFKIIALLMFLGWILFFTLYDDRIIELVNGKSQEEWHTDVILYIIIGLAIPSIGIILSIVVMLLSVLGFNAEIEKADAQIFE